MIYLDCAASTPPDPRVVERMLRHMTSEFGNPGSYTHDFGAAARKAVEQARDQIASAAGARRSEIFFTSGATEANNLAILGLAAHLRGKHIVTSAIEHPAVLEPMRLLASRHGCEVTFVDPTPGGWVDSKSLLAAVRPDTGLVSLMHVNNETGVMQPIDEVASGLNADVLFHVDASQSFGKIFTPIERIDLLSLSAHKMGGPQGVGALMVRRRARALVEPLQRGGGQEGGLRPGTLPLALIAGFGLAAELARQESGTRLKAAQDFQQRVLQNLKHYTVNGDLARTSPHILNLAFPGLDNQQVTEAWRPFAAISNGSACTSKQVHCSHVLHAMGCSDEHAASAVRLSWNHETPLPDFEALNHALASERERRV